MCPRSIRQGVKVCILCACVCVGESMLVQIVRAMHVLRCLYVCVCVLKGECLYTTYVCPNNPAYDV